VLVLLELRGDAPNAADSLERIQQPRNFRLEDWTSDRDDAIGRVDANRVRMRDEPSELRAHSPDEHAVVDPPAAPKQPAQTRREASRSVCDIAAGGAHRIAPHVRRAGESIAGASAPAASALRIQEVHQPDAKAQARQHRATILQHDSPPFVHDRTQR
jgi:hypothetical protein